MNKRSYKDIAYVKKRWAQEFYRKLHFLCGLFYGQFCTFRSRLGDFTLLSLRIDVNGVILK